MSASKCSVYDKAQFSRYFFNILYITIYVGAKSGVAGTAGISPLGDSVLVSG